MSSGLDKTLKDEAKGFAGLSSMVSDVGDAPSIEKRDVEPEPSRGASQPVEEAAKKTEPQPQPQPQPQPRAIYQDPPKSNDGGFQGKWLIGIAVVVGLVWLASSSGKKSPEYPPAYSTSTNSAPAKVDSPTWQPPISDVQVPTKPSEETPPVGTGLVLSQPQIRYCSAESIRLDAAKEALNAYNDSDVNRFNALVADYNSRCSSFRYRSGSLESARSEVERYRAEYEAEGRKIFASSTVRPRVETPVASSPPQLRQESPAAAAEPDTSQLSQPEEESIEAACSTDKYLNGAAAYRACRERQVAALRKAPRRPDLSGLASAEQESIEAACSSEKYLNGPASYNRCLTRQLSALNSNNRRPSLDSLSSPERESIEAACSSDKYLNGPAAYNRCLSNQLSMLSRQSSKPDLSNLNYTQRQSVEAACSSDKYLNGPAAYNSCLSRQIRQLR